MNEKMTVAFAMGGLAGNNAHGAGFLQAALDRGVEPLMISCTSGQILWVSRYLKIRNGQVKEDLRDMLREDIHAVNPTNNKNVALAKIALVGKVGVFAPAYVDFMRDMTVNAWEVFCHIFSKQHKTLLAQEFLELFPSRLLIPDFPSEFFSGIANILRQKSPPVGILFNSYNPRSGKEHVYLNDKARELLHKKSRSGNSKYAPGRQSDYRDRTTYQDIDDKAVHDALWLYQYGFDRKEGEFVDGAYFRGLILSELAVASRIFCVRPINHCWKGDLPRNYPELEDLKTEIGFDGAYCGERYQINFVNKHLEKLNVAGDGKYHHIDLQELEIKQPRGYFDYLFESEQVFDDAYKEAMQCFDKLNYPVAPKTGTSIKGRTTSID